jgi:hypothetical protein
MTTSATLISKVSVAPLAIGEVDLENYLQVQLTPKEFTFFEANASGSHFDGGYLAAVEFLTSREERLCNEADEADLPTNALQACRAYLDDQLAVYETTRGTLCSVLKTEDGDEFWVSLPNTRLSGKHHYLLCLAKAGMQNDAYHHQPARGEFSFFLSMEQTSSVPEELIPQLNEVAKELGYKKEFNLYQQELI